MADEKTILRALGKVRVKIDRIEAERSRLYAERQALFCAGRTADLKINQRVMAEAAGVTEPVAIRARKRCEAEQQEANDG